MFGMKPFDNWNLVLNKEGARFFWYSIFFPERDCQSAFIKTRWGPLDQIVTNEGILKQRLKICWIWLKFGF